VTRGPAVLAALVLLGGLADAPERGRRPADATGRDLGPAGGGPPPAANPLIAPLWDDGRAELSLYRGSTPRYGEDRTTEMRLIVVKEDLLRDALVKSERGPVPGRTREAIKLHMVADFRTGTYDYHQTATVFFDRRTTDVLKEAMSHTESCGITYVRVGRKRGRWIHESRSYWEGEADREVALAWPPGRGERLFWDGLPVTLRRWVHGGRAPFAMDVWVLPSQVSGRAPIEGTRPFRARLEMSDGGTLTVPAGRFRSRKFELRTPSGRDVFWFDEAFPYPLLRLETSWGRKLALRRTMRLDYWNHQGNGDERLLAPAKGES
jgi:hypothetical protein